MSSNILIPLDDKYAVSFPSDTEIIIENEDGSLSVLVDIYKFDEGQHTSVKGEEVTEELRAKVEALVNTILNQAIEDELGKNNVED